MIDFVQQYRQFFLKSIKKISIIPSKQVDINEGFYTEGGFPKHKQAFQFIIENEDEQMRLKLRFGNAPHVLMEAEVQILLDSLNIEVQKKISPKLELIKNIRKQNP